MLIYTTMRNVQGEDRCPVSILASASHLVEEDRSTPVSPVGLTQHTPNRTEKMPYVGLQCVCVDDG